MKGGIDLKIGLHIPKVHDMTIDTVDVISTSAVTADVSPVVLSQTEMIRLKFCPTLVDNEKDPHKSVSGKFLYEKKRKNDAAFPSDDNGSVVKISRGSVKVGDWMELNLSTSETYELYQGLKRLYALYEDMGEIPYGSATYTRVDSSFRQFLSIIQNDSSAARMIGNEENYDLVKTLLWGDRIFEKCGIGRDEGGDGGKTLEIRGKRRLSARDGGANYQQS